MLTLLILGSKSTRKCLRVFLRYLIDELKILWNDGVQPYDRHDGSSFIMMASILWTISNWFYQKFNGLVELRDSPKVLSGRDVLSKLCSHQYPPLSMKSKP